MGRGFATGEAALFGRSCNDRPVAGEDDGRVDRLAEEIVGAGGGVYGWQRV